MFVGGLIADDGPQVFDGMLKEICSALIEADVCFPESTLSVGD